MFRQTLLRVSLAGLFFNTLILNLNNVWIQAPRISGIQLLLSLLGNDREKSQAIITEVFFLDRSRSSFPQKVDSTLLFLDKPKLKNPISPRISPTQTTSENILQNALRTKRAEGEELKTVPTGKAYTRVFVLEVPLVIIFESLVYHGPR